MSKSTSIVVVVMSVKLNPDNIIRYIYLENRSYQIKMHFDIFCNNNKSERFWKGYNSKHKRKVVE